MTTTRTTIGEILMDLIIQHGLEKRKPSKRKSIKVQVLQIKGSRGRQIFTAVSDRIRRIRLFGSRKMNSKAEFSWAPRDCSVQKVGTFFFIEREREREKRFFFSLFFSFLF